MNYLQLHSDPSLLRIDVRAKASHPQVYIPGQLNPFRWRHDGGGSGGGRRKQQQQLQNLSAPQHLRLGIDRLV
jgi:hypothetical protein